MGFEINDNTMRRLFEIWSLPLPHQELVLFALRGSRILGKPKGWSASLKLELAPLDYQHLRCTIGIWNQKTGKVFAAPGSTVPHRDNVLKAASRKGKMKGRGTNQIEPGFYTDLHKGEHLQGKLMGHAALRQTAYRFYRRTYHAPPYTKKDPLYFSNPYDNLHCAWNLNGVAEGFRSSGCMVVAGMPHCPRLTDSGPNQGAWKTFHDLVYAGSQKNFPLLLLPAAQVQKTLTSKKPTPNLCYRSQGKLVEDLQRSLKQKKFYSGSINGKLDAATYRAWNRSGENPHIS